MQLIAWQTSLLMNATGNYKTQIKPEDLYKPKLSETTTKKKQPDIEQLRKELRETFNL
ncbi:hypothetical protein [Clostridium felsineum]|uniref:hypothetical protein n=1 Tax=Clostridium felsineum TaxID=36839 RepID=UPI002033F992|nr:hypothetical protein [Clostridium felsineum]